MNKEYAFRMDGAQVVVIRGFNFEFSGEIFHFKPGDVLAIHGTYDNIEGPSPENKVHRYYTAVVEEGAPPIVVPGKYCRQLMFASIDNASDPAAPRLFGHYNSALDAPLASIADIEKKIDDAVEMEGGKRSDYSWADNDEYILVAEEGLFEWSELEDRYISFETD